RLVQMPGAPKTDAGRAADGGGVVRMGKNPGSGRTEGRHPAGGGGGGGAPGCGSPANARVWLGGGGEAAGRGGRGGVGDGGGGGAGPGGPSRRFFQSRRIFLAITRKIFRDWKIFRGALGYLGRRPQYALRP